ncbi:MAG: Abi family protein [Anaerolineae bacterium]|nr:Abi family protein [Anaerolineae bacterium]MDK1082376.1 Abi family protein [Anaerolineae bacterium]MDK1119328.1 Abi family protein [Anaerolineae bacterium]
MKYTKPALSFEKQAQQLLNRGLIHPNKETLARQLSVVNYYRLSAYWYPFKQFDPATGDEHFAPKTTFEMIWRRYTFDRQLRLLVMDAIEHVEVAILRTRMVEQFTLQHGPFGYCEPENFNPRLDHPRFMREIDNNIERSKEEFVQRFRSKYNNEPHLPLWMTAEVMTFGQLFTLFRFLHRAEKKNLAQTFGLYPPVLESWLHTLLFTRNACAHHARLWNREIPIRPKLPDFRHSSEWYIPVKIDNRRVFTIITILKYLLSYIVRPTEWSENVLTLLNEYAEIPIRQMGFPEDWQKSPLWR